MPCNTMQFHAIPCNTMQYHAIPCNTMQYHTIPCNNNAIPCNTRQYHASLITAEGAYHCPRQCKAIFKIIFIKMMFSLTGLEQFSTARGSCCGHLFFFSTSSRLHICIFQEKSLYPNNLSVTWIPVTKIQLHFVNTNMSWFDKTANITRPRHINLHKCWSLAGFLFTSMILWVGIWLEPVWVSRTWVSTSQVRSQISAFHTEGHYEKQKFGQTDTGTLLLLLIPVSVFGFFIENSRGVDILRPQRKKSPEWQKTGHWDWGMLFFRLKKASFWILFLCCEHRLILIFTGEGEGWPRPPCIQSEAVFPTLRLTEIITLLSESSGVSRTLVRLMISPDSQFC